MGFYFRKSVNFGPVRFNFSKSGLGISVGVKGARISTGPRGTYIHAGSHGFYYRQRLDTPNSQAPREVRWDSQTHAPRLDAHRIETADVSQFGDVSSGDLLQQINACAQHMRYAPLVLIATLLATLITTGLIFFVFHAYVNTFINRLIVDHEWANTVIPFTECVLSGFPLLVGLVWADKIRKEDIVRRTTPLFYALEENALARFTAVQKSCATLARSMRLWRVETKQSTFDWKRNAGASSLITRKAIHVGHLQPPCIVTNVTENSDTSPDVEDEEEDEYDEQYDDAVALVTQTRQASISMLQRRLRVGYNRAARMIEMMEKDGIVGPADGIKPREVLKRNTFDDM